MILNEVMKIIMRQGKSQRSDWFFLVPDLAMETVISRVFFVFESIVRAPYNKLRTNLVFSSRAGEYWSPVVLVRTSLAQYGPHA